MGIKCVWPPLLMQLAAIFAKYDAQIMHIVDNVPKFMPAMHHKHECQGAREIKLRKEMSRAGVDK